MKVVHTRFSYLTTPTYTPGCQLFYAAEEMDNLVDGRWGQGRDYLNKLNYSPDCIVGTVGYLCFYVHRLIYAHSNTVTLLWWLCVEVSTYTLFSLPHTEMIWGCGVRFVKVSEYTLISMSIKTNHFSFIFFIYYVFIYLFMYSLVCLLTFICLFIWLSLYRNRHTSCKLLRECPYFQGRIQKIWKVWSWGYKMSQFTT